MLKTNLGRSNYISLFLVAIAIFATATCASCATTLNHGRVLDANRSELTLRSPNAILGTQIDYQYGITENLTVGVSAKGMLFPGGEIYGIYGVKSDIVDVTLQGGVSVDPYGYDRQGDSSSFGPWMSWSSSIAVSKRIGDFRPYFGLHGDHWKALAEMGSEWKWEHLRLSLSGISAYFYNDYGPVEYRNSGIVFSFKKGATLLGIIPAVSWEF